MISIPVMLTTENVLGGALFIGYLLLSRDRFKNLECRSQRAFGSRSRAY